MGYLHYLIFLLTLSLSHPHSVSVAQNLPYKAVNLGNWLVAEGWMKPSLFDGITNKDLLVLLPETSLFHFDTLFGTFSIKLCNLIFY